MNLGQPERLYLPFLPGVGIPVLTILVVVTTFLQTKLSTPASTTGGQGAQMNQMMTWYMPLLLGYFAFTLNAGLALYFVASNVLAIAQYALVPKPKLAVKQGGAR
jgi:YidC/Oxa1 family membrane protein insertase